MHSEAATKTFIYVMRINLFLGTPVNAKMSFLLCYIYHQWSFSDNRTQLHNKKLLSVVLPFLKKLE